MGEPNRSRARAAELKDRLPVVVGVEGLPNEWRRCSRILFTTHGNIVKATDFIFVDVHSPVTSIVNMTRSSLYVLPCMLLSSLQVASLHACEKST